MLTRSGAASVVQKLIWTLNSLIGLVLTLPAVRRRVLSEGSRRVLAFLVWPHRWARAWQANLRSRGYKLRFGLHQWAGQPNLLRATL